MKSIYLFIKKMVDISGRLVTASQKYMTCFRPQMPSDAILSFGGLVEASGHLIIERMLGQT